jgi:hypothetical protein
VGVVGMLLYVSVFLGAVRRLGRVLPSTRDPDALLAGYGARNALIGLIAPCLLLQPFVTPVVGWVVFALAGAALGSAERAVVDAS